MFALSDSEGVSHSQSVNPEQIRTATLFENLEGAIKNKQCIPKTAQTSRTISRSINKQFEIFEATAEKTANSHFSFTWFRLQKHVIAQGIFT